MLGAHATFGSSLKGSPLKAVKLHRRQVWIIGVLLLALAAGWWAVGSGALSRLLPLTEPVTAAAGQIVIEQAQPASLIQSGQTAPAPVSISTAADDTVAPVTESIAAETAPAEAASGSAAANTAAASTGPTEPVAIAGVAGVNGASVWDDTGALLATLDSGALVTVGGSAGDGTWLSVKTAVGAGWTPASSIIAYGLGRLTSVALPDAVIAAANTSIAAATRPDTTAAAAVANADVGAAVDAAAQSTDAALIAQVTGVGTHLNIRSGPGTDYGVIAQAEDGATYMAVGCNAAGDWLLIQTDSSAGSTGWVSASFLALSGDLHVLPVVDATAGA